MNSSIKAIIFDLDGVLVDTSDLHKKAFMQALKDNGFNLEDQYHQKKLEALPTKTKLKILKNDFDIKLDLNEIYELKQAYTRQLLEKASFDGWQEPLVSELKDMGFKLAVCSNSIGKTIQTVLNKLVITNYIDVVLSCESVTSPKPSPEMYIKAMKTLRVSPTETVILEDSDLGIKAAKESMARVLKINNLKEVTIENILKSVKK